LLQSSPLPVHALIRTHIVSIDSCATYAWLTTTKLIFMVTRLRYWQDIRLAIYRSRVRVLAEHYCVVALGKLYLHLCVSVTKQYSLVPAKGMISLAGKVTAGLVESNSSLPPGLWLMSPAGWLPRNRDQLRAQRSSWSFGVIFSQAYIRRPHK